MQRRYVHGAGVDDPQVWYEGSGTSDRRWLHADERGSVVAVTDGAGAVLAVNTYDAYGKPGSQNIGRFQYTGQTFVTEVGLYHYKARFYSPDLGRFLQTDPIGYEDQTNLYAYVGNDPINLGDPTGTHGDHPTDEEIEEAEEELREAQEYLDIVEDEVYNGSGYSADGMREIHNAAIKRRDEAAKKAAKLKKQQKGVYRYHEGHSTEGENTAEAIACGTQAATACAAATGPGAIACGMAGAAICAGIEAIDDDGPVMPEDLPPEETPDEYEQ